MANQLDMGEKESILRLFKAGWSKRKLSRDLGFDRGTVKKYILEDQNHPISPAGSPEVGGIISPAGKSAGRPSKCDEFAEQIKGFVDTGLNAQRIYQDLRYGYSFGGSYDSVKRYIRKNFPESAGRVWRLESPPGEEAQVDFGKGGPIEDSGHRRKSYVFRIVLSFSRKAYSEAVFHQTTESFIRCLENAFRYFGGVPATIILDNLRAAVSKVDWYEPEINPKIKEFASHYGTVFLPARPYTPEHKGKVESGIKYIKNNALKGRTFKSLKEENDYLAEWETNIADKRIHGTTRKQVAALFQQEKPSLKALPVMLFPCFQEALRRVHRDSFVEVARAYYEVPQEYVGTDVWVRWDSRTVRVFNNRFEQVSMHAASDKGKFNWTDGKAADNRPRGVEHSVDWILKKSEKIGVHAAVWVKTAYDARGVESLRALYGFIGLTKQYDANQINRACEQAIACGLYHLRDIKTLITQVGEQKIFEFIEKHPLIRDMEEYGSIIQTYTWEGR